MGFALRGGPTPSPLRGAKEGNTEFLAAFELVDKARPLPAAPPQGVADDEEEDAEDGPGDGAAPR